MNHHLYGKDRIKQALFDDLNKYQTGFFLTLNTYRENIYKFEEQVRKLLQWLNFFCYGNAYNREEIRLSMVGVIENGDEKNGLHVHVIIRHNNDTRKTMRDIESFIRRKWYILIEGNMRSHEYGNLVNLKPNWDLMGSISYIVDDLRYGSEQYTPLYFE